MTILNQVANEKIRALFGEVRESEARESEPNRTAASDESADDAVLKVALSGLD